MMNQFFEMIGNFHPVLVHLPIGFLLLGLIFQWLSSKEKYAGLLMAVRIAFLLGMMGAVLSCITGWILASGGEYDDDTLNWHRWMGISVAVISLAGYLLSFKPSSPVKTVVYWISFLLIIITGHLGGTLTHGDGFLTKAFSGNKNDSTHSSRKVIANVQEAQVFADIIQPILQDKCGSCHSAVKQKGGLRLDGKDWIIKGGKEGSVYSSGHAEGSELYKRVVLDPLEEKHMPPKGKPQLTEQEVMLLHWWINSNAGFDKKVKEATQDAKMAQVLLALQSAPATVKKPAIPDGEVDKAPEAVLDSLRAAGVTVLPVSVNSNYLTANFVSIPKINERTVLLLDKISKQLVWLKLGYANLSANAWKTISNCTNLIRLSIEHTNITDADLAGFASLTKLQYLNLAGTKISAKGLPQLKNCNTLENVYLGNTAVGREDFIALQKQFPKAVLDSGNYRVENIPADTQLLKAPVVKK